MVPGCSRPHRRRGSRPAHARTDDGSHRVAPQRATTRCYEGAHVRGDRGCASVPGGPHHIGSTMARRGAGGNAGRRRRRLLLRSSGSHSSAPTREPTADSIGGLTLHLDGGAERTTSGLVQIALDAPEGSTEAQVSVDPTFAGAEWQAIGSIAPLQLTDGGQQLVFARVRSGDGTPGQSVVATIDYDATWDAATASAKDGARHRASWAGLVAPDVLQIRVEDGRVIQQGAPPHDQLIGKALDTWSLDIADQYQLDGAAVTSVSRISRPLGLAHLAKGETSPLVHDLYLRLSAPLTLGQDHVVQFPGDDIDDLTFRIDPTSTRSSAVHVNQVGFAPGDDAKQAMVSSWTGAAGGIAYGGELDFEVVDAATGSAVLSGTTTSRTLSGRRRVRQGRPHRCRGARRRLLPAPATRPLPSVRADDRLLVRLRDRPAEHLATRREHRGPRPLPPTQRHRPRGAVHRSHPPGRLPGGDRVPPDRPDDDRRPEQRRPGRPLLGVPRARHRRARAGRVGWPLRCGRLELAHPAPRRSAHRARPGAAVPGRLVGHRHPRVG